MCLNTLYIWDGSLSHSGVVPGHNHVIGIWFVPSCYSNSASSAHIHGFYDVRMHWYVNPLHQNMLKHFIYILDGSPSFSDVVPGHNHVIVIQFVPSCYSDSASSAHIHGFYEVRMHWYVNPLYRNVHKHFIYILDGSLGHSGVVPGHNHVIVLWSVPSCYSDSASSAHIHGFYEIRMHWYVNPLHLNVLKHFIYILYGSPSCSDVVPGHNHVIVIWFVPSCYSDSASSAHIHGFYEVRMHWYVNPLHQNVLKHFINILDVSLSHSDVVTGHNHAIVVAWFVPSCYSDSASSAYIHGFYEVRMIW